MITPNDVATAKLALGAKLAAFRHAAGLNQHGLAKLVITSRSSIANIESGRQVSTRDLWERCDAVLKADGALVHGYGQLCALQTRQHREDADGHDRAPASKVNAHIDSRPTVVDKATTAPGYDWVGALSAVEDAAATPVHRSGSDGLPMLARLEQQRRRLHSAVSTGAANSADLDDWEETVLRHGYATRSQPAVDLLNDLEADCADLERALAGRHNSRAVRRLTVVSAQMAGLMFLTLIKLNQPSSARLWARTARVAAGEAGVPAVDSWVRAQEAYVYYYSGNLTEAVAVARHAQARAVGTACVGLPLAAALEARALAAMGHRREAVDAVRRAETAVDKLDSGSLTRSAFGYDEAQLRFHEGNALTHLHDTASAGIAQRRALELYPDTDFLDRTLVQLDRATCLANDGDVSTAMHQAVQALTGLSYEQRDGLVTVRGTQILASLPSEQRASPAVKEFRDLLMLTAKNGRKAR